MNYTDLTSRDNAIAGAAAVELLSPHMFVGTDGLLYRVVDPETKIAAPLSSSDELAETLGRLRCIWPDMPAKAAVKLTTRLLYLFRDAFPARPVTPITTTDDLSIWAEYRVSAPGPAI